MATLARRREVRPYMVYGSLGVVIVLLVATDASRIGDVVVVVDVAIGASPRRNGVQSGQREARLVVVKIRWRPTAGRVADFAGLREVLCDVIRILRTLIVLQVTGDASRIRDVVVVVDVAIGAGPGRNGVQAGQREARLVVVVARWRPTAGRVADFASLREVPRDVIRVFRALIVL